MIREMILPPFSQETVSPSPGMIVIYGFICCNKRKNRDQRNLQYGLRTTSLMGKTIALVQGKKDRKGEKKGADKSEGKSKLKPKAKSNANKRNKACFHCD